MMEVENGELLTAEQADVLRRIFDSGIIIDTDEDLLELAELTEEDE